MKTYSWVFSLPAVIGTGALLFLQVPKATAQLQQDDLLAICGDSITEQNLYSLYISDYLLMCQPAPNLRDIQFGWGGEQAKGFLARMQNDVLVFKPSVATLCYGMNDGGYAASTPTAIENYRRALTQTVRNFKAAGVHFIVVGSPGAVDTKIFKILDPQVYNQTLSDLTKTAQEVAEAEKVTFANIHDVMIDVMSKAKAKYGEDYPLGKDGFHPFPSSHIIMAYTFLKALGCKGEIGIISVDLKTEQATASIGHRILAASKERVEIESSKYPFCFFGDASDPMGTVGMTQFVPFNEELNRYILVVKNAPSAKVTITWGDQKKEFAASDLEKGINLAAEFPVNPFTIPFQKVQDALKTQHQLEWRLIRGPLHSVSDWNELFPDVEATLQPLAQKIVAKILTQTLISRRSVVPVRHVIQIGSAGASQVAAVTGPSPGQAPSYGSFDEAINDGEARMKDGDSQTAKSIFAAALEMSLTPVERGTARWHLGAAMIKLAEYDEARKILEQNFEDRDGRPGWPAANALKMIAESYRVEGNSDEMKKTFQRDTMFDFDSRYEYKAWLNLAFGEICRLEKDYDTAIQQWDLVLKSPTNARSKAWASYWKGMVLSDQGKPDEAIKLFRNTITLSNGAPGIAEPATEALRKLGVTP